ncbi:MAG: hypothetical protein U0132_16290 [Gemmatimonadaceae bacterium]
MDERVKATSTTVIRRYRPASKAAWWAARTKNVLTRRHRLTGPLLPMVVLLFGSFVVLPVGIRNVWARYHTAAPMLRDIGPLLTTERRVREQLTRADSDLAVARVAVATPSDSIARPVDPRSDSLVAAATLLQQLLRRAADAPLSDSYRAIAESPVMRSDARARALLDSLTDVERERAEFGSGAAVDPLYVALTTRANALGRSIVAVAESKRQALRRAVSVAQSTSPASQDSTVHPDTTALAAHVRELRTSLEAARRQVAETRALNDSTVASVDAARVSQQLAPTVVLVASSTVLAIILLFAFALVDEIRAPRVAEGSEAERLADTRVLSIVRTRVVPEERMRRRADRERPPLLDPQHDAYRMLAWHITALAPHDGIVVLTGDTPSTTATIAANIAAVLANEARATLLLDVDFREPLLADILGIPAVPGIAAVLENRRRWSETIVQVTTGRGRSVDCIPAGMRPRPLGPAEQEALGIEIHRAAKRYDITVVHAPLQLARRALRGTDALVCASLSRTRLSWLARTAAGLRDDGARVLGVALWEGDAVRVRSRRRLRPSQALARRMAQA